MSRIHEALKKAEQERAVVQTVGADILTAAPIENPPPQRPLVPETEATSRLVADKVVATTGGYLRFDDLRNTVRIQRGTSIQMSTSSLIPSLARTHRSNFVRYVRGFTRFAQLSRCARYW
jgi:hypothetical protein